MAAPRHSRFARRAVAATLAWIAATPLSAAPLAVFDPGQGAVTLASGTTGAAELSGIAWTGGTSWLAVGDNGAKVLWRIDLAVDGATGRIGTATVSGSLAAPALGSDSEGIAYRADTGTAYVSDEVSSTIAGVALPGGGPAPPVAVPSIFAPANVQSNLGLEALGWGSGRLFTANEETLRPDGAISSTTAGSLVRIQSFDAGGSPVGQWAYRTDPISAMSPLTTAERSGVVDILPWSATSLLVLERELGGVIPRFRSRLYGVDVGGAMDVSALPSLAAAGVVPLTKTLLWEGTFLTSNFEGMSFGPVTAAGRSLVLVSDDGGGLSQNVYALVVVPEPTTTAILAAAIVSVGAAGMAGPRRRRTRPRRTT